MTALRRPDAWIRCACPFLFSLSLYLDQATGGELLEERPLEAKVACSLRSLLKLQTPLKTSAGALLESVAQEFLEKNAYREV